MLHNFDFFINLIFKNTFWKLQPYVNVILDQSDFKSLLRERLLIHSLIALPSGFAIFSLNYKNAGEKLGSGDSIISQAIIKEDELNDHFKYYIIVQHEIWDLVDSFFVVAIWCFYLSSPMKFLIPGLLRAHCLPMDGNRKQSVGLTL